MINPADLPDDIELLKAIVLRQQDQNARLAKLVADFKRALFGAKSEKTDPDQYELAFEDIETAIEVTGEKVPARVIGDLMQAGREMLACPIELLPHAREAVEAAADTHRLVLITKGDLLDQERKLAQSGLGDLFDGVEIVSDKTAAVYATIFARHGDGAGRGLMVGNSMRSDVVPVIEAGGWGVYVPHGLAWEIEHADPPHHSPRYRFLGDLGGLAALLSEIS